MFKKDSKKPFWSKPQPKRSNAKSALGISAIAVGASIIAGAVKRRNK